MTDPRRRLVAAAITPAQQDPTGPSRPAEVIHAAIDAADTVQRNHAHGAYDTLAPADADGRARYAAGVADALTWVLGHHPVAELAALIGGDV
jgi:hypothetical protein